MYTTNREYKTEKITQFHFQIIFFLLVFIETYIRTHILQGQLINCVHGTYKQFKDKTVAPFRIRNGSGSGYNSGKGVVSRVNGMALKQAAS